MPLISFVVCAHLFVFAKTVENACASQAILAVLLNRQEAVADLGSALTRLYEFTKDFRDPAMRGEAIGSWWAFSHPEDPSTASVFPHAAGLVPVRVLG